MTDLIACGPAAFYSITRSCRVLLLHAQHSPCQSEKSEDQSQNGLSSSSSLAETSLSLRSFLTLARQHIKSVPFSLVPRHWLRLYTDVSLLASLYDVLIGPGGPRDGVENRLFWEGVVRRLDMAIIVAGAVGDMRQEWVMSLIKEAQKVGLGSQYSSSPDQDEVRKAKRPRKECTPPTECFSAPFLAAPNPVEVFDTPPSLTSYIRSYRSQPFIIRNYFNKADAGCYWPSTTRWASMDYLLEQAGKGRVVPVEVGGAYDDSDWGQQILPLETFLRRAGYGSAYGDDNDNDHDNDSRKKDSPLYLAQYNLFSQFPDLLQDISYPDYVWSEPPAPETYPTYRPPQTDDGVIVNVWVGSGNSEITSPAHTVGDCLELFLNYMLLACCILTQSYSGPVLQLLCSGVRT